MTGAKATGTFRMRAVYRAVRACVLLSGLSALGGCMLDPGVPSPALDVPANFTTGSLSRGDQQKYPMAFDMFRSPALTKLITKARASNLDIAAAVHRIRQADAQVRVATQALIPSLDLGGSASQSYGGSGASRGMSRKVSASLSASYEIDFWGKNRAGRSSVENTALATRYDGAVVVIATDASVAQTYFQALAVSKRISIARNNLAIARRTLKAIKAREEAGTASGLDVAQQETQVANVRATIPPLEQSYAQHRHALAVLLGKLPEGFKLARGDLYRVRVPRISAGLPSDLLIQRPDIAVAEAKLVAARFDVSAARAALFPSIKLTGEGGFESTALKTLFRPDSLFYQMASGLSQPLLNAYSLKAQLEADREHYMELLETYRKTIISSFQDTEDALVAYRKTAEQERLQRKAAASARKAYEISAAQLKSGVIDLTTLLSVQRTLFSAEDAMAEARLNRLNAAVSLYKALGGGWQRPISAELVQAPSAKNSWTPVKD
ncbi:MAG: efflux transporter outer membrane subunit [Alphaproteobacteria bacterium]